MVALSNLKDQMMTNKLTSAQTGLLRSGFLREDHCIAAPAGKGASVRKSSAKMIESGWLKEIKAKAGVPIWRTDEATGATYSLKLTAAGLKVIAADALQDSEADSAPTAPSGEEVDEHNNAPTVKAVAQEEPAALHSFREGSKLAGVMKLLRRDGGVTIDELSVAMNWLPHSTRAVLTGLRKRGILVARRKTPEKRASAYVVEAGDVAANGRG